MGQLYSSVAPGTGIRAQEKSESLVQQFGIDYQTLPAMFRQGSSVFWDKGFGWEKSREEMGQLYSSVAPGTTAIFMGCNNGEIELGFSNDTQVITSNKKLK